jgi:hypothetical protein
MRVVCRKEKILAQKTWHDVDLIAARTKNPFIIQTLVRNVHKSFMGGFICHCSPFLVGSGHIALLCYMPCYQICI